MDVQYAISKQKVTNYCAKYATKCEPCSEPLKSKFAIIVKGLTGDSTSLKAVQRLLLNSVGEIVVVIV